MNTTKRPPLIQMQDAAEELFVQAVRDDMSRSEPDYTFVPRGKERRQRNTMRPIFSRRQAE